MPTPKPRKFSRNSMSYSNLVRVRDEIVDGVKSWLWVAEDSGAWDGPSREWMQTHRDAYLRYVKTRNVVVQAGGNCGLYPRLFSEYFQTVYTFEPDPLNFHCLVNNCQRDNVIKINAALGDGSGLVRVKRAGMGNVGMHTITQEGGNFPKITPQFSIDSLCLEACDLIQLDVEGYEPKVIDGAMRTIEQFHPVISCENGGSVSEKLLHLGYEAKETVGADTIYVFSDKT